MNSVPHLLKVKRRLKDLALSPGQSLAGPLLLFHLRRRAGTPSAGPHGKPRAAGKVASACHPQHSWVLHTSRAHVPGTYLSTYLVSHLSTHDLCLGLRCEVLTLHKEHFITASFPVSIKAVDRSTRRWLATDTCNLYTEQCVAPTVYTMSLATHTAHTGESAPVLSCHFACTHMGHCFALVHISSYMC